MKIVISGNPIGKSRHKCACIGNKPRAYDPQIKNQMQEVKEKMLEAWNSAFDSENKEIVMDASNLAQAESFQVSFTFLFPVPKSGKKGHQNAKLWGFQSHNSKPDFDNLEKFYSDCATGIIWKDDCQVVFNTSKKYYDENPRIEMEIMVKKDLKVHPDAEAVLLVFGPEKLKEFLKDVSAFWPWRASRVDEIVASSEIEGKDKMLVALSALLAEFASKHAEDLKKIQKYKRKDLNI